LKSSLDVIPTAMARPNGTDVESETHRSGIRIEVCDPRPAIPRVDDREPPGSNPGDDAEKKILS